MKMLRDFLISVLCAVVLVFYTMIMAPIFITAWLFGKEPKKKYELP